MSLWSTINGHTTLIFVENSHERPFSMTLKANTYGVNTFDDNPVNDRITMSPALNTVEQIARAPSGIYKKAAEDKGRTSKVVDDAMTLFTAVTGIPVAAAARPTKYLIDVAEGEVEPKNPVDFIRGVVTGTGPRN